MRNIFSKIFGGYLIITVLLSGLILFFAFKSIRSLYLDNLENELFNMNYVFDMQLTPILEDGDYSKLDSLVKVTGAKVNARITVIDLKGVVIADSENDPLAMENHINRPEFIQAREAGKGSSLRYSKTMQTDMMYAAVPVENTEGKVIAYSRFSLFFDAIDLLINDLTEKIRNVTVLVVLFALIFIWLFSKSLTRPIKLLVEASRKVAEGDFDVKVNLKNKDELKKLADSFNSMTSHIKQLFAKTVEQQVKLDSIMGSIKEGFVVIDNDKKIILSNAGFKKIFNLESVIGLQIADLIDDKGFQKLIKKTGRKKKNIAYEIELDNRYFLCSANYIRATKEIVIILYDITQLKQLEQVKKDFVVNVSHELRTPLTAIKGFIETLEDDIEPGEENDKIRRYLGIIQRHTNRLVNIVNDLLLLSNLEDTTSRVLPNVVNIKDLTYNVLRIFEQKLSEKNLNIICKIEDDIPDFMADMFKLEQLFVNLIDNAIKYTDEGGISINISNAEEKVRIIIEDTGIGIPKKHLDRIFERFYTVDKSRSRKLGGTGLGLSIVKHIVMIHNGTIEVESDKGEGTKYTIEIPLLHAQETE